MRSEIQEYDSNEGFAEKAMPLTAGMVILKLRYSTSSWNEMSLGSSVLRSIGIRDLRGHRELIIFGVLSQNILIGKSEISFLPRDDIVCKCKSGMANRQIERRHKIPSFE